jgi:hypothetical protein
MLFDDEAFRPVALPVFGLDAADACGFVAEVSRTGEPVERWIDRFGDVLRERRADLVDKVRAVCGDAPWIVRSSGAEDTDANINAGGYDSLVCWNKLDLYTTVARVALSGYTERSIMQQRLADPHYQPAPIAAFVQPLVAAAPTGDPVATGEAPLLDGETVDEIVGWLGRLHRRLGFEQLDSEWVMQTDAGIVSCTGLTTTTTTAGPRPAGQLAFGFGFASAQRVEATDNSVALLTGAGDAHPPLWEGRMLRRVQVQQLWIVQVRPAPGFEPAPQIEVLTEDARRAWRRACPSISVGIVVPPRRVAVAGFLSATTLDGAWARYLRLAETERTRIGHVVVERGSAAEHAGVMFRQAGVAVLRAPLDEVPAAAGFALVDPWEERCYFGEGKVPRGAVEVRTEVRRVANIPSDCQLVFEPGGCAEAAVALIGQGRPLVPASMPGAEVISGAQALPPATAVTIIARSFLPMRDCHRRDGAAVTSPSFVGQLADELIRQGTQPAALLAAMPSDAVDYVHELLAARGVTPVEVLLPRLSEAAGEHVARLVPAGDLRLTGALADLERHRPAIPSTVLGGVAAAAARHLGTDLGVRAALAIVTAVRELARAMDALAIYDPAEQEALLAGVVQAASSIDPARTLSLSELAVESTLPPRETLDLLTSADNDPEFAHRYGRVRASQRELTASATTAGAPELARRLNRDYAELAGLAAGSPTAHALVDNFRRELVEVYDAALKGMLLSLVDGPDETMYRVYLDVMATWLDLAAAFDLTAEESRAAAVFAAQIEQWRAGPPPADYTIEDFIPWQVAITTAARRDAVPADLTNPHQLHNVLHQWLLARVARFPLARAPRRLVELHSLADRFGPGGNKLLRFGRGSFEIGMPVSIHKASFVFHCDRVEIEWAEPPGAPEGEIGRLAAFEAILRRFNAWFGEVRFIHDRVLLAGTWTLRITARPAPPADRLTYPQMRSVLLLLRTLFDAAYDFSYVAVEDVAGVPDAFADDRWRDVFAALVDYRRQFDDSEQLETLETLPVATLFGALCLDGTTRQEVLRAVVAGPSATVQRVRQLSSKLASMAAAPEWASSFSRVQHLTVLLAAAWPEEAFDTLMAEAEPDADTWVDQLSASLLRRLDLRDRVTAAVRGADPSSRDGLVPLVLRHVPYLFVTHDNAEAVAHCVLSAPKAYRRCKQYLLHRHAETLAAETCRRLVADLEVVPFGRTPAQEVVLATAVEELGWRWRTGIRATVHESELHSMHRSVRHRRGDAAG